MDNILNQLYEDFYQPDPLCQAEKQALWDKYLPMCHQVQETLGIDFLDQFTLYKAELTRYDNLSAYRQGFRLGTRLTMETFGPLTSAKP